VFYDWPIFLSAGIFVGLAVKFLGEIRNFTLKEGFDLKKDPPVKVVGHG
jgi:hypothetical protein